LLAGVEVVALNDVLGRRTGLLLGRAKMKDAIDAAIVLLARDGDEILTADLDDLRPLAEAAGLHVDIVEV
jgi:hypothetical protein